MINTPNSLPRRHLLVSSASALAVAGLATWTRGAAAQTAAVAVKPLPAYVSGKDSARLLATTLRRCACALTALPETLKMENMDMVFLRGLVCRRYCP